VLVGLDPQWESLPESQRLGLVAGQCADIARAFTQFCRGVIDVVAELVAVVKPQAAFFEQLGPSGVQSLADVIAYARQKGLLVIVDGKRNDIGSTATAYARAYLGAGAESGCGGDALTVSPYLGDDSLQPFVEAGTRQGAGIFVLVKTSNPGGGLFQDLTCDGRPLYQHVAAWVEQQAVATVGQSGYGIVGAVVGATYPQQQAELRELMPHTWFLVPGFGAQGAGASDVRDAFAADGRGAIVNSSRGIIFAHRRPEYRQQYGESRWQSAVEAATRDMIEQLREGTPAGRLGRAAG
jgi:orotidine-5'-phosphate decarboxylase